MNFEKIINNPFYFNLFLLRKLPMAWMAGLKLSHIDDGEAKIVLPYRRLNLNPFGSIYFASMAMASELSTGVLVMRKIAQSQKKISMLVVDMNGKFEKRGMEHVTFVCENGIDINRAIEETIKTGEGQTITLKSTGYNSSQEVISEFDYTWSIKLKSLQ